MNHERPDSNETDEHSLFLSEITSLSLIYSKKLPELDILGPNFNPPRRVPFSYDLTLGPDGNQYKINFGIIFTDEWTTHEWLPHVSWKICFNNQKIFSQDGIVNTAVELHAKDFQSRQTVESAILREFRHAIGGPDTEVPFMDYETYSLESLSGEYRYFENIYLVLMTHMKERGLVMPPILGKRDYIRQPMLAGEVSKVDQIIAFIMASEPRKFPGYIQAHMKYEAEEIKKHAIWEAKKRNPAVPIQEAFPYLKVYEIERGKPIFPPYTVLAVENDLNYYGSFSSTVIRSLEADGRFRESQVIREINLSMCMQLCQAGRVDIVLFDWTNPSHEEIWSLSYENPNPFYQMLHGSAQAVISTDENGIITATPDGRLLDSKGMIEESEKIDMRNKWMDLIRSSCSECGVQTPPSFIFRSKAEFQDIAKIVCQKLNRSIS
ncbi:hypothetical protein A2154_00450 [Candidatus Gottesmanbacteria bacterium RBG_16_43_7]|uniref:Uncharacterized protein n=1 Tax=Candidatus Gottesmanbacteria bacterium RBG_16_43_7 TaxID=1798373 RepID=A0A1F5ZBG2_9BACT|nr:MAG: hypothetical protein A2154_00450 [Candidatus Gottesmanbacteria bacterium RBG_16_43_7]